jgi:hypothetical protein
MPKKKVAIPTKTLGAAQRKKQAKTVPMPEMDLRWGSAGTGKMSDAHQRAKKKKR